MFSFKAERVENGAMKEVTWAATEPRVHSPESCVSSENAGGMTVGGAVLIDTKISLDLLMLSVIRYTL